jgi:bacterioferritin-associated ferredoxin
MIVCHCNGVSDRAIRRSVRAGAVTPDLVARACGAGACCGGCRGAVQEILHGEMHAATASASSATPELAAG